MGFHWQFWTFIDNFEFPLTKSSIANYGFSMAILLFNLGLWVFNGNFGFSFAITGFHWCQIMGFQC